MKVLYLNPSNNVRVLLYRRADGQEVVVKEVERPSDAPLAEVESEGRIAQSLNHPNICRVFNYNTEQRGSSYFLLIEMEKGDSDLGQEIYKRKSAFWSEEEIWNMLLQTVSGLSFAQSHNTCHRDIKPQNILIQASGRVLITDFGTAKLVSIAGLGNHTLQGTLNYLSPELLAYYSKLFSGQIKDKPVHDPYRSDVYSLGLSFIEMIQLTFPNEMRNILHIAEKTELTLANLNCSEELKMVLGAMVEPDAEARPNFLQLASILEVVRNCSLDHVDPLQSNYSLAILRTYARPPDAPSILITTLSNSCQRCGKLLELGHIQMGCGHQFCLSIGCLESLSQRRCPMCNLVTSVTMQEICLECRKFPSVWFHSVCGRGYCQKCSSAWKRLPFTPKCVICKLPLKEQETIS